MRGCPRMEERWTGKFSMRAAGRWVAARPCRNTRQFVEVVHERMKAMSMSGSGYHKDEKKPSSRDRHEARVRKAFDRLMERVLVKEFTGSAAIELDVKMG